VAFGVNRGKEREKERKGIRMSGASSSGTSTPSSLRQRWFGTNSASGASSSSSSTSSSGSSGSREPYEFEEFYKGDQFLRDEDPAPPGKREMNRVGFDVSK